MNPIKADEDLKDIHFPKAGLDVSCPFGKQPNRPYGKGKSDYARTTPVGVNVRTYDGTNRARGGSRPGMSKFIDARVDDEEFIVQCLAVIVITSTNATS